GLVIAAVMAAGMSTLDSSINVSATVWVIDFYKRLIRRDASDQQLLNMTRWSSISIGVLGTLASLLMIQVKTVLDTWWKFSGIFGGAMLGLFLLGILVRKATPRGAVMGVLAGILVALWGTLCQDLPGDYARFNYPLHAFLIGPTGTLAIVLVGWAGSLGQHKADSGERKAES
ncbi:MAG: sodium:solute symporter, partial [Pirellulales bacterium]